MRKLPILILCFLFTACDDQFSLTESRMCGSSCAIDEDGNMLFGEDAEAYTCNTGILVCTEFDETCEGFRPIGEEICNGIDDDCKGGVDDIPAKHPANMGNTCRDLYGICAHSWQECVEGEWTCIPPDGYGVEVCDSIDNDCDGSIDNDDTNMTFSGPMFGYDGPIETINVGECRGYVRQCVNGYEQKFGQVLQQTEICGNGMDDDCDGFTDENEDDNVEAAFALLIDVSGSMGNTDGIVRDTVCEWAVDPRFSESRFAIYFVGAAMETIPTFLKVSDFDTAAAACAQMISTSVQPGGEEWFLDLILALHDQSSPFQLDWPNLLDKRVIIFSDEEPQTEWTYQGNIGMMPYQAVNAIQEECRPEEQNYSIGVFGKSYMENDWDDLTSECDGWFEELSNDKQDMLSRLNYRARGKC